MIVVIGSDDAHNVSPAAECMRISRQRRRGGLRCLTVELRVTEIGELVRRGYLPGDERIADVILVAAGQDTAGSE